MTIADTAGLRESSDLVEGIGIERARQAAQTADIVLYLIDLSVGLTEEDRDELERLENVQVIYTKADLAPAVPDELSISAVSDAGMEVLLRRLDELVRERFAAPEGSLVNERQRAAVAEAASAVQAAIDSVQHGFDEQMILVDLYRGANALALLTGAITREDVLSEIFGKFCIGK